MGRERYQEVAGELGQLAGEIRDVELFVELFNELFNDRMVRLQRSFAVTKMILIVDDSTSMRQMVAYTLRQAGFGVIEGTNGQDALEKLDGQRVELIITDLNMPVMDGITFIKRVRSRPASRGTPVLMLTTESQDLKRQEAKAAGATGWIVKPFHPDKLLHTVSRVLP
jgi:two-component system chemotaxis response regulator CheY